MRSATVDALLDAAAEQRKHSISPPFMRQGQLWESLFGYLRFTRGIPSLASQSRPRPVDGEKRASAGPFHRRRSSRPIARDRV